jgi:hypothetical protein
MSEIKEFEERDGEFIRILRYYPEGSISFQTAKQKIDILNTVLFGRTLFINGVLQEPGSSYQFSGGTSFTFSVAPDPEDNISVFFYRGTRNQDSILVSVNESLKRGDTVQLFKNPIVSGVTTTQNSRLISYISASDKVETNIYGDQGIDVLNYKPFSWTKQKVDSKINGEIIRKTRDSRRCNLELKRSKAGSQFNYS